MKLGAFALTGTGSDVYRIEVETVSDAIAGAVKPKSYRQNTLKISRRLRLLAGPPKSEGRWICGRKCFLPNVFRRIAVESSASSRQQTFDLQSECQNKVLTSACDAYYIICEEAITTTAGDHHPAPARLERDQP